jgi:hypothetical protein
MDEASAGGASEALMAKKRWRSIGGCKVAARRLMAAQSRATRTRSAERTNMRALIASLAVACAVVSMLIGDGGASQSIVSGTVIDFEPGEWISVSNDTTDPAGVQIALRDTTVFEARDRGTAASPEDIQSGVRVTVWYRGVGERRPVADRIRVLAAGER